MDIIQAIEARRVATGQTKREIARLADINEDYYTKIVNGNAPGVAHSIVMRLAEAAGLSILVYIDINTDNQ